VYGDWWAICNFFPAQNSLGYYINLIHLIQTKERRVKIEICEHRYTTLLLQQNQDKVFVFGDNMVRRGCKGQAIIRGCPNSFGIATKRLPNTTNASYFSDRQDEMRCVINDLRRLWCIGQSRVIVFPVAGIGTGLAEMRERSPLVWEKMCEILEEHFGFDNRGGYGIYS